MIEWLAAGGRCLIGWQLVEDNWFAGSWWRMIGWLPAAGRYSNKV
jgi:hypothetical protein